MLDGEALHIISVHDLLDALVVVQNGQARHLVELTQMAVITITATDELVTSGLQRIPLEIGVLQRTLHPLVVRLFGPVGPHVVVEGDRCAKLSMQDPRLIIDVILDLLLVSQIVLVLMDREVVVLDRVLGNGLRDWYKRLLVDLADRLAVFISNDVSVADLLIDCRIKDQCATGCTSLLIVAPQRDFLVHRHTHVTSSISYPTLMMVLQVGTLGAASGRF